MSRWWGTATLVILLCVCGSEAQQDGENYRTLIEIEKCGFGSEQHEVQGSDGYATTVFRMRRASGPPGQPVLLQHGFLSSSDSWFQLEANSLPCLLTADGYDVWLSNARGNSYSRSHSTLSTESLGFWTFSFHEMAVYDISATIDYIRSATKKDKVSYVGHSTGGTLIFVLLSVLPEYNRKINVAVSFAPVCFMSHTPSHLLRLLAYTAPYFEKPMNWLTYGEVPPFPDPQGPKSQGFNFELGAALGELLNYNQILQREMVDSEQPGYLTDGTSMRTVLHLAQLVTRGNFSWYDFGKRNPSEYEQQQPPNYELRRITAQQLIMYSDADHLVVEKDAKRLCTELPAGVGVCHRVDKSGFSHADFLSSNEAEEHVYSVLFKFLKDQQRRTRERSAASQGRGMAASLLEEEWDASSAEEDKVAVEGWRPAPSPVRGMPAGTGLIQRAPDAPQQKPVLPSLPRAMAGVSPGRGSPSTPPEKESFAPFPKWGMARTSPEEEVTVSSQEWRKARTSAVAGSAATTRLRGSAADPAAWETAAISTGKQVVGKSGSSQVKGKASTRSKVCRYTSKAGRLQKVCYNE